MKFIRAEDKFADKDISVNAPYIRRAFMLDFVPTNATLTIATPGFYELYVNGERITKGFIAPYISNPDDFICYDEYEISNLLKNGKNAIGIILGNGFSNQITPQWSFSSASFRAPLSVSVTLSAKNSEKTFTIESDELFKCASSPIIYDMYRYGTHYDARLEAKGWSTAEFDDSAWKNVKLASAPKGEIVKCTADPIKLQYEIKPSAYRKVRDFCYLKTAFRGGKNVEFSRVQEGYLYDFGASHSGVCKLRIKGEKGQKITLRHAERLDDDGNFTLNSIYTFNESNLEFIPNFQTDIYTLMGDGEEEFIPPFTYHCFRYVLVEGLTDSQATDALLTFQVFNSDIKKRSNFTCSSDTVNKLYEMGINADLSNFHYFPTDCPHREKNGWTGDVTSSAEQLLLSFNCKESLRLWLKSLRHAQLDNGMLPGIVPTSGWGYHWGNGPFWDAAATVIPYYIYKYDGDISILSENANTISTYIRYITSRRNERGLIAVGLGDWVQPKNREIGMLSPLELTDSVTVYNICLKAGKIFDLLGNTSESEYAKGLANELKSAIRSHLIDYDTMSAAGNCQTSQALLIYFSIFEKNEMKRAYERLIEIIENDKRHIMCGVIGLRYIFEVLIRGGYADLALEMIVRPDAPSYGSMIERGATALCEALEENGLQESENHHFLGDIIRIFTSFIAGLQINPNLTSKNQIIFSPTPVEFMKYAKAEYHFDSGKAICGWERTEHGVKAYAIIPTGVRGDFVFGPQTKKLSEGYNEFAI